MRLETRCVYVNTRGAPHVAYNLRAKQFVTRHSFSVQYGENVNSSGFGGLDGNAHQHLNVYIRTFCLKSNATTLYRFSEKASIYFGKRANQKRWICICLSERDFSTSFLFQNRNSRCEIFRDRKDVNNFCCFSLLFGKWAMNHGNCTMRTCCMNLKDCWWQASQMYLICVKILKIAPAIHKLSISYFIQNKIPFVYVVSILMI